MSTSKCQIFKLTTSTIESKKIELDGLDINPSTIRAYLRGCPPLIVGKDFHIESKHFFSWDGNDIDGALNWDPSSNASLEEGDILAMFFEERWTFNLHKSQTFVLDATDVLNRYVTLSETPANATEISFDIQSASAQSTPTDDAELALYKDFYVNALDNSIIAWDDLALDGMLSPGDVVKVTWLSSGLGRKTREKMFVSKDDIELKSFSLGNVRVANSSMHLEIPGSPLQIEDVDWIASGNAISVLDKELDGQLLENEELYVLYHTLVHRFPIKPVVQFATTARHGLAPKLRPSIRSNGFCDKDAVPSELAFSKAISDSPGELTQIQNGTITALLSAESIDVDVTLMKGVYPITWTEKLLHNHFRNIYSDSPNVVLGNETGIIAYASKDTELIADDPTFLRSIVTGGSKQFSTIANLSGSTDLSAPLKQIAVSRVLIEVQEELDDYASVYSIGTDADTECIVKRFRFDRGIGWFDRFEHGNETIANGFIVIPNGTLIKLHKVSGTSITGIAKISICYDEIGTSFKPLMIMGNYYDLPVNRINLCNDVVSVSKIASVFGNEQIKYASVANPGLCEILSSGGDSYTTTIDHFLPNTGTRSFIGTSLSSARSDLGASASETIAYFIGGEDASGRLKTNVDGISFSTQTLDSFFHMENGLSKFGTYSSDGYMFIVGGVNADGLSKIVQILDEANNVVGAIESLEISTSRQRCRLFSDGIDLYSVNGDDNENIIEIIDKLVLASSTCSTMPNKLPYASCAGMTGENDSRGIYAGGLVDINNNVASRSIQEFSFETSTWKLCAGRLSDRAAELGYSLA